MTYTERSGGSIHDRRLDYTAQDSEVTWREIATRNGLVLVAVTVDNGGSRSVTIWTKQQFRDLLEAALAWLDANPNTEHLVIATADQVPPNGAGG